MRPNFADWFGVEIDTRLGILTILNGCSKEVVVGINWNEDMMRWRPHVDASGVAYPLNHLHPFRYDLPIAHAAVEAVFVEIRVAFAMHCFTRACVDGDDSSRLYFDDRETRAFCHERYAYSQRLPDIARTLSARSCGYAKDKNYVTVEVPTPSGVAGRYGVFFNVMRIKGDDGRAVLLTVQSAYELSAGKQLPGRGSIKFARLVELTLQGIKPRPPH